MFGKCKACEAHIAHVATLKAQVELLQRLTSPPPMPTISPMIEFEQAFSAGDAPVAAATEAEFRRAEREAVEAAAIFMGENEELGSHNG